MKAIVHVSIDKNTDSIKFEVDIDSLPDIMFDGYEVIAKWHVENFNNNNTFYTDSNGLEMQKRILNYRPTWDIQQNYNDSNENITANYYPIQQAISMKTVD
jgi:lysosomal alpha-mannosidase